MSQVQSIYDRIAKEMAIAVESTSYDGSFEFQFSHYLLLYISNDFRRSSLRYLFIMRKL